MKIEAKIGMMQLQAKSAKSGEPLPEGKKRQGRTLFGVSEGARPADPFISDFWPLEL